MTGSAVLLDVADGVATVTLNRPGAGNAVDLALADGLRTAVRRAAADESARVVLLRGSGRRFCVGGDLHAMQAAPDRAGYIGELARVAHDAVRTLAELEKPVVAAVRGSAAGAGLSLVLLADLVLAAPGTTFVTAYTRVGLTPDCGQSWLLPRAVGTGRALELVLTSRRVPADEAASLGMITRVVDDATLDDEVETLVRRLATGAAHATGPTRRLVRAGFGTDAFNAHLDLEAEIIARTAATEATGACIQELLAASGTDHPRSR